VEAPDDPDYTLAIAENDVIIKAKLKQIAELTKRINDARRLKGAGAGPAAGCSASARAGMGAGAPAGAGVGAGAGAAAGTRAGRGAGAAAVAAAAPSLVDARPLVVGPAVDLTDGGSGGAAAAADNGSSGLFV
jgi:hypothetical protein